MKTDTITYNEPAREFNDAAYEALQNERPYKFKAIDVITIPAYESTIDLTVLEVGEEIACEKITSVYYPSAQIKVTTFRVGGAGVKIMIADERIVGDFLSAGTPITLVGGADGLITVKQ
jgi:hypothetical protein